MFLIAKLHFSSIQSIGHYFSSGLHQQWPFSPNQTKLKFAAISCQQSREWTMALKCSACLTSRNQIIVISLFYTLFLALWKRKKGILPNILCFQPGIKVLIMREGSEIKFKGATHLVLMHSRCQGPCQIYSHPITLSF